MSEWKTTPRPQKKPHANQADKFVLGLASTVLEELPPSLTAGSGDLDSHVSAVAKRVLARRGVKPHWQPKVVGQVVAWVSEQRK